MDASSEESNVSGYSNSSDFTPISSEEEQLDTEVNTVNEFIDFYRELMREGFPCGRTIKIGLAGDFSFEPTEPDTVTWRWINRVHRHLSFNLPEGYWAALRGKEEPGKMRIEIYHSHY
jgi:hypothetical protein